MKYSIYLHIPFCRRRCHYCDFITYAGMEQLIPAYIDAIQKEIRIVMNGRPKLPVHTIFFGGGTPSLLPVFGIAEILEMLKTHFIVDSSAEITLEANPGTLTYNKLTELKSIGINRLSLGVQSTNDFDLQRLDRIHTINDILDSYRDARLAGFNNINLDLIFGLPWQDLHAWEQILKRGINLKPEHFSIYSLIIEPDTPLHSWYQHGLIQELNEDILADMYQLTMDVLSTNGYRQYEISNYARSNKGELMSCQHNLQYWLNQPYFGFGAGAHGYINGYRTENTPRIDEYIRLMSDGKNSSLIFPSSPAMISKAAVNRETRMKDFMFLALRLVKQGAEAERFYDCFGISMNQVFSTEISALINAGLVAWQGGDNHAALCLTRRGIMVANQVFMAFV